MEKNNQKLIKRAELVLAISNNKKTKTDDEKERQN